MPTINGTPGNDVITAPAAGWTINAGAGDDSVTLVPNSTGDGGPGDDLLVYDLSSITADQSFQFYDGTTQNFERIHLTTGSGNDTAYFYPATTTSVWGPDVWDAGAGTDMLVVGLIGFTGDITAGYINATTYQVSQGGTVLMTAYNVEKLYIDARLTINNTTNTISGGSGNDLLYSYADHNFLNGGGGDDTLYGYGGTVDGGSGFDRFVLNTYGDYYSFAPYINFNGDGTITYTDSYSTTLLKNIEGLASIYHNVLLGTLGNDSFTLDYYDADTVFAGPGDDTITILAGTHIIDGGGGNDTVVFSPYNTINLAFDRNSNGDVTVGGSALINVETVKINGVVVKFGSNGVDILTGTSGDEILFGSGGNDTLDGGGGNDTAAFTGNYDASTITFNLDGSYTVTGPDGADTLRNIENVTFADIISVTLGTVGNDSITLNGSTSDARPKVGFAGGAGNDTVTANSGAIFFDGGNGTDTIILPFDYQNVGTSTPFPDQPYTTQIGLAKLLNVEIVQFNNATATLSGGVLTFTAAQPILNNNLNSVTIYDGGTPTTLAPDMVLTNAGGSPITGAVVKIASGFVNGDLLAVNLINTNINANYNTATGVLTLSGPDTAAHYQQALRSVQMIANSIFNGPTSGSVTWQVTNSDASHNISGLWTTQFNLPISSNSIGQMNEATFISGVYSNGTIASHSFRTWMGDTPAHYDPLNSDTVKWGANTAGTSGGTVSYYFDPASNWTAAEQTMFSAGLAFWSAVANINFVLTANPGGGITFVRGHDGDAGTTRTRTGDANAGRINTADLWQATSATVSIDTSVPGFGPIGGFSAYGGYTAMTVLHEEGHALGLGHGGSYNGNIVSSAQEGIYDSELWTLMSYIDPENSRARYYSSYSTTGTNWGTTTENGVPYGDVPTSLMAVDIQAAQLLYGAPVSSPLSGGQVFGFNTNIVGAIRPFFDFTQNSNPIVTLWDMGTNNTLDLSGFSSSATVNLNPGTFSSCDGMTNNIAIAPYTKIDRFIGGAGADAVIANNDGDTLFGGAGNDKLTGGYGNDTLDGGSGLDKAVYSGNYAAYAITKNIDGSLTVSGGQGTDTLIHIEQLVFSDLAVALSSAPVSDFNGTGLSDLLWQNTGGQAAVWLMNGATRTAASEVGSNPGPSWHVKGNGDFNGDGNADILWQNDTGPVAIWFMNGTSVASTAVVGDNPGTRWHAVGAGDFNGDGKADIVFQNLDGSTAIWMMNGTSVGVNGGTSGPNLGKGWHLVGIGDFNADTKADLVFQKANGDIAISLMDGLSVLFTAVLSPGDPNMRVKAVGDFDNDAKADILWQNSATGQASIWNMDGTLHTGGGIIALNPGTSWHVVGTGTYDTGNQNLDILWQNDNGNVASWYMNNTTRMGGEDLAAPGSSWKIANSGIAAAPAYKTGDFNGDGKADVLWQNNDGTAAVWTMNGATRIGGDTLSPKPDPSWHVIGSGDFNADGEADVLWQNNDGTAAVWLMNGAIRLGGDTLATNPGAAWHVKGAGDFNGDVKADVLWQNNDGTVAVWTMNGATRTGDGILANPGPTWHVIGSGDFNSDTKADILLQNDDGRAGIWLVSGFTLLQSVAISNNPGTSWHAKGAGDFDGDGKSDILWQNDDGRVAIWLMDGTTQTSGAALAINPGPSWSVKGAADTNDDGMADILFQNNVTGEAAVWLMSGFTKIGGDTLTPNPGTAWHLFANAG